jgi:uncharacterized membrane protein YphA (DoxX/SURF4 family)
MAKSLITMIGAVLLGWVLAGLAGAMLGRTVLPPPPPAVADAAAGKPFDSVAVSRWLDQGRRPGQILVWGILPSIAIAIGLMAAFGAPRTSVLVAPTAFFIFWRSLFWGDRWDRYDWSFTAFYLMITTIVAWLTAWVVRRRRSAETQTRRAL